MTKIQEYSQAEGPFRPVPGVLTRILKRIPSHVEIRAISINGQTGDITVETYHDLMDQHIIANVVDEENSIKEGK